MPTNPSDIAIKNLGDLIAKDPLLRDIVNPILPTPKRARRFNPDVDVFESDTGWTVILDVPGVQKSDLTVELDGSRLVISGTRSPTARTGPAAVAERPSGRFEREFLLPAQVSQSDIRARLELGVLTVFLPRTGTEDRRSVDID